MNECKQCGAANGLKGYFDSKDGFWSNATLKANEQLYSDSVSDLVRDGILKSEEFEVVVGGDGVCNRCMRGQ